MCFTRTFMELKRRSIVPCVGHSRVLLVPLWNWNSNLFVVSTVAVVFYSYLYGIETRKSRSFLNADIWVLLVPLWNWNNALDVVRQRIVMFYSYLYGIETCKDFVGTVIQRQFYSYLYGIETILRQGFWPWEFCFTRTFMELKHPYP